MLLNDLSFFILVFTTILTILGLINNFCKKNVNAFIFVIPTFLLFYVFPIIFDNFFGLKYDGPDYSMTIYQALNDQKTSLIYNLYISFILLVFNYFSISKSHNNSNLNYSSILNIFSFLRKWNFLIYFLILSPIMLVILGGDYIFYSTYADRERLDANLFQSYASKMAVISLPIIILMLNRNIYLIKNNKDIIYFIALFILLILVSLNIYIHGKRSIFAAFIFLFMVSLLITKVVSKNFVFIIGIIFSIIFYSFLMMYGKNIEGANSFLTVYEGLRLDFSRDYSLKFVIYHELLNDNSVLPYMGASYLFLLTFFVPRDLWIDKPMPYAVYFTNSVFGDFGGDYFYGWGLTTSFVSEAVSNIGILGLALFPIFYIFFIKIIDNKNNILLKMLGYLIMVLLLVLEPMAIMILIFSYFLINFFKKYKFKFK